jgi:predicted nucleotidyltransferase
MSDIALLIRRAREDAGLTQPALAEATGIQQPRLSQYENGKVRPSPETLDRILTALEVRPSIRLEVAQDEVVATAKRFHADAVWVFGSCADGSDTPASDVDLVVEFDADASTYDLANLTESLESLLGVGVDTVSARTPSAKRFLEHAVKL